MVANEQKGCRKWSQGEKKDQILIEKTFSKNCCRILTKLAIVKVDYKMVYDGGLHPWTLKVHYCRFENLPIICWRFHILLFEIRAFKKCEKFVYKHLETIECVKN